MTRIWKVTFGTMTTAMTTERVEAATALSAMRRAIVLTRGCAGGLRGVTRVELLAEAP